MNRWNIAFVLYDKKTKEEVLLYGISIPTIKNEKITKSFNFSNKNLFIEDKKTLKNKTLLVYKKLTNDYNIDNEINLVTIFGQNVTKEIKTNEEELKKPPIPITFNILNRQEVIQTYNDYENKSPESILKLPIKTDIYYTDSFLNYHAKKELNYGEIVKILNFLKETTSLSFIDGDKNIYSKRLGCFEYIKEVPDFIEKTNQIFEVKSEFYDNEKMERFYLNKLQTYNKPLTVILTIYNDLNDIIFCQKKEIKAKENNIYFDKEFPREYVSAMKYQIFDNNGNLISDYKCAFIKRMQIALHTLGGDIPVKFDNNNFTKKSICRNTNQVASTSVPIKTDMNIGYEEFLNENWNYVNTNITQFYKGLVEYLKGSECKSSIHIDSKTQDKVEKIQKFLKDIANYNDCTMTILDPYFGITIDENSKIITANSFEIFYTLDKNIKLKIISSLNLSKNLTKENKLNIKRIFDNFKDYNLSIGDTEWFDFNQDKKFHDRYIKIENNTNREIDVYMVSNSFNSLLEAYPLIIVKLFGNIKENALKYIVELEQCSEKINVFETLKEIKND